MTNILKRQETRVEIDGIKIKNPTPEQKAFIQEFISSNYKINETGTELEEVEDTLTTGTDLIRYMLRNLTGGIEGLTDEEINEAIKDPSLTLRKINVEFNEIVSEITQETLMAMATSLKEAKLLTETAQAIEKIDNVLKVNQAKNKNQITIPTKRRGRPKKNK